MAAVLAYAVRRTSARVVLVVGAAGVVWAIYRAVRPFWLAHGLAPGLACPTCLPGPVVRGSTDWDLAVAALAVLIALVASAALWRGRAVAR